LPSDEKGKLYLIGGGPGDAELLTLKAARVLGECDVVLYDRLVSADVLSFARADAELIYVGKQGGEQHRTQARIFDLILSKALNGKKVARLKGGDPLVFGRGAEEWADALKHGIEVELIPGVTSAVAVPGLAGIPLTYRGVSQSFAVITGHCHEGLKQNWSDYAGVDTLIVLMGVTNRRFIADALIGAGRNPQQPVAFIERGTLESERVIESTLASVAAGDVEVASPAVFVIGEVVRLRASLTLTEEAQPEPIPAAPR
jgi:uroporphyrin-III C-methyltransferase